MHYIEITDITGARWAGDVSEDEDRAENEKFLADILSDFKKVNSLSLNIGDDLRYFNPVHVVSVAIVAVDE